MGKTKTKTKKNHVNGLIASHANYHITCAEWLFQEKDPVLVHLFNHSMNTIEMDLMHYFVHVGKGEGSQLEALCRMYTFGLENRFMDVSMSLRLNSNSALARNWLGVSTTNGMFVNLASSLVLPVLMVSELKKFTISTFFYSHTKDTSISFS